jgi:hypothetical protein
MKQLIFYISIILLSSQSIAQPVPPDRENFWIPLNKPTGGQVFSLVAKSVNEVYAGTGNGVYLSNNGGETWENIGLLDIVVYSLIVHQNGNLFAGTGGFNTIYRLSSIEVGWEPVFSCVPNIISLGKNSEGVIFAGSGGEYGLLRSVNTGDDWESVLLLGAQQSNAIAFIGCDTVFVGTTGFFGGGGVFRSYNSGDTWERCGLLDNYISSLAINFQGVLFAGSVGEGVGLFRSYNNGNTWEHKVWDITVDAIAITPNDVIYIGCSNGGVSRSFDDGNTWEIINSGMGNYPSVEGFALSPDGYLYAYSRWSLHRSAEPVFTTGVIVHSETIDIKLFPNPFTNLLHIEIPSNKAFSKNVFVKVTDITSRQIYSQALLNQPNATIDLSFLKPGLFFITIYGNGQLVTKPIVKTNP